MLIIIRPQKVEFHKMDGCTFDQAKLDQFAQDVRTALREDGYDWAGFRWSVKRSEWRFDLCGCNNPNDDDEMAERGVALRLSKMAERLNELVTIAA